VDRKERRELLERLRADADRISDHFQLQYRQILADNPRAKSRYGLCYEDGLIKIRLNHIRTRRPLKYSSLMATLCHELAHLRHFDHSPNFHKFFLTVLRWARRKGLYQPGKNARQELAEILPRSTCKALGYDGPPKRAGVPVFISKKEEEELFPWEVDEKEITSAPPSASPGKQRQPEQLKLFD
jgi:hypothetical protein